MTTKVFSESDQFLFLIESRNGRWVYWRRDKETGKKVKSSFSEACLCNRIDHNQQKGSTNA